MKHIRSLIYILTVVFFASNANAACKDVKIATMTWASAQLMAQVDKLVLEKGFGCNVEIIQADTVPAFTGMNEKGSPDLVPELWANSFIQPLDKAIKGKSAINIDLVRVSDILSL